MDCKHSLYFKYEDGQNSYVGCLWGCGYKASIEVALSQVEPTAKVVPVQLGLSAPSDTGLMIKTDQGYMGVITGCMAGVLYVEKITSTLETRGIFEKLVATALGVAYLHDGNNLSLIKK